MVQALVLAFLGAPEIIMILVLVLLLFGGRKIPEMMKGLGKGVKEFKEASENTSAAAGNKDPK